MLCEGRETSGDFVGNKEQREAIGGAETIESEGGLRLHGAPLRK